MLSCAGSDALYVMFDDPAGKVRHYLIEMHETGRDRVRNDDKSFHGTSVRDSVLDVTVTTAQPAAHARTRGSPSPTALAEPRRSTAWESLLEKGPAQCAGPSSTDCGRKTSDAAFNNAFADTALIRINQS
jgi:hypothetical protein